jgi:hypothetical protein
VTSTVATFPCHLRVCFIKPSLLYSAPFPLPPPQDERLAACKAAGESHYYLMEIDANQIIDARHKSNLARFINHSCEPNTELQRWSVDGYTRIGVFAKRVSAAATAAAPAATAACRRSRCRSCSLPLRLHPRRWGPQRLVERGAVALPREAR